MFRKSLAVLTSAVVVSGWGIASSGASMRDAREPTSALGLASLLASKKLGCTDFLSQTLSPPTRPGVTLPVQLQQLVDIIDEASTGSCTLARQETLLVVFANRHARTTFEDALSAMGCMFASIIGFELTPNETTTPGATPPATTVPIVEIGSRSLVFSTGTRTATGNQPLNLPRANASARRIAKAAPGKVKTIRLQCR